MQYIAIGLAALLCLWTVGAWLLWRWALKKDAAVGIAEVSGIHTEVHNNEVTKTDQEASDQWNDNFDRPGG